ncbi:hypothetical protein LTR62_000286 [Meristemomyces frigidus]|uniref:Protection of telomeres protein 1 n=1 Tax=Meristemomyces frigidus TaxID=1508187 RepID=A0AAN7TKA9_9PEZI|nr:hypothetical protein LTR62_000286 [Meristemomyces frigidus]
MAPPKDFIDLATAYKTAAGGGGSFANIIGVVVDMLPPRLLTSTNQWMFTFKLLDPALQSSLRGSEGLTVRFFKADETHLPQLREHGDVVLLRQVKLMQVGGQPVALSNFQTASQVFPSASIPSPSYSIGYQGSQRLPSLGAPDVVSMLTLEEQAYVIHLKADVNVTKLLLSRPPRQGAYGRKRDAAAVPIEDPRRQKRHQGLETTTSGFGRKYCLIKDTRHLTFSDLCVQVVKKFPAAFDRCELYVTDYTENQDMFYYRAPEEETAEVQDGDTFGYNNARRKAWPGPYGWFVLKVNVLEPHANFANDRVNEGDLVLLRNVKIKAMAEGSKLEGDMWKDDLAPDKVKIHILRRHDIPEIKELMARKEKYWAKRQAQQPSTKPTKNERKRARKQMQQEREAEAAKVTAAAADRNKHVRCSNEDAALISIKDILDVNNKRHTTTLPNGTSYILPFVNTQYRSRVQVIDYSPKRLEDFSLPSLFDDSTSNPSPIDMMSLSPSQPKYEWFFSLLLQDASSPHTTNDQAETPQLWAHVSHQDAQFLFGNDMDDPCDLRSDSQMLAKLREKLCILWGNLEEKKEGDELSSRPFECCLQEYGVELDGNDSERAAMPFGYQRSFKLFGTTIL